ncbi:MAG: DUF1302 domain-containing protein [Proteobacteria bacterium]|nr:DUF1302 domain-containing protein [Pseudomonadota bacterium]
MTSATMNPDRRSAQLAAVIGTVLACYAGSATAIEFEFENGGKLNWNTTVSVGASWRAEHPSEQLFTRADGSLIGLYSSPLIPGTAVGPNDGLAGNHAAGDGNLNYAKNDRFSTPFKVITDIEYKKGRFGALLRAKYWYDQALNQENVLVGSQANNYNGVRPGLGPIPGYTICTAQTPPGAPCLPVSPPGQNLWPKGKLSDRGFEAEQQFENVLLLDAYVYGSFAVGNSDLQLRLGNQVINWGESIFIQGVNQINPIDVPAARRAGAELKEILLPVWAVYANWGFDFGSLEAFYQLKWNNTSVDGCGTYFTATSTLISANPGACDSITVVGGQLGNIAPGTASPIVAQLGSQPFQQGAAGTYVPAIQGREPSDSGQFGLAFRFPVEKIDTEIGLYAMNIHSRLPVAASITGTNWKDLPAAQQAALTAAGLIGTDAYGNYWTSSRLRSLMPGAEAAIEGYLAAVGLPTNLESGKGFWEYPEDIQIYGISAATNLLGWSTSAELSYQVDVPVMVNGNDLIGAGVLGIGPYREIARQVQAQSEGTYLIGHSLFNKTQFQVNAVKTFSNVLGAENMLVVGEIGSQWNNVPDYTKGGIRYGRGFMYGTGSGPGYAADPTSPEGQPGLGQASAGDMCSPTFSGLPVPVANRLYNPQPNGCRNDGYVTDVAWGYRLRVSMDYNNVMNSGVTVTPNVFWAHDVEGVSMDPTFIEDRMTLGLGVKFNYNKKYVLDLNYVSYDNDNFDPLFDRDYYSAAVSVTF